MTVDETSHEAWGGKEMSSGMMTRWLQLLIVTGVLVLGFGCAPGDENSEGPSGQSSKGSGLSLEYGQFTFSSGGAHHISGFGEWSVRIDSDRSFHVTHNVRGKIREWGPCELSAAQASKIWKLVDELGIKELPSSSRSPVPDEGEYTFGAVLADKASYSARLLWNDAHKIPGAINLRDCLYSAIQEHTGEKIFSSKEN